MIEMLRQEIARSEQWDADHDLNEYPYSAELYAAVEIVLAHSPLSDEQSTLIVAALAQDDEAEWIQDFIREHPEVADQVARAAIVHSDYRARWQAAVLAGEVSSEDVVRAYLNDPDEYVRRRALLSARVRFPVLAETTAITWIESSHEYSRMVALDMLFVLKSNHYRAAADRLVHDPSPVVMARLKELDETTTHGDST